jgi:hypothetical protein
MTVTFLQSLGYLSPQQYVTRSNQPINIIIEYMPDQSDKVPQNLERKRKKERKKTELTLLSLKFTSTSEDSSKVETLEASPSFVASINYNEEVS